MSTHHSSITIAALFVVGCAATPPIEERTRLSSTPACCEAYRELKFEPLQSGTARAVEISASTPVMVVGASKSYVAAFVLPSRPGSLRRLTVHSHVLGGALTGSTTFCPSVILLDEKREQIAFADVPMTTKDTLLGVQRFSGELPLPEAANYIVIFTSRAFGGSSATFSPLSPGYTALLGGNPGWGRPVGPSVGSLPCSPIGRLEVTVPA